MQVQLVDPSTIPVWRWHAMLWCVGMLVACSVASSILEPDLWPFVVIAIVAGLVAAWFVPIAYYNHLRYGVDERGIVIQSGILWRSHVALPRSRIQHTDVSQGPLQRRFGVGTLKLYTAGSRYTRIELPGLRHEDAMALRDELLATVRESGV